MLQQVSVALGRLGNVELGLSGDDDWRIAGVRAGWNICRISAGFLLRPVKEQQHHPRQSMLKNTELSFLSVGN